MKGNTRRGLNQKVVTFSTRLAVPPSPLYKSMGEKSRCQPPIFVSYLLIDQQRFYSSIQEKLLWIVIVWSHAIIWLIRGKCGTPKYMAAVVCFNGAHNWIAMGWTFVCKGGELVTVNRFVNAVVCRLNRYVVKTFLSLQVGIIVNFDEDDPMAYSLSYDTPYNNSFSISCYQLYDVALSQAQIKKTMDLCRSESKSESIVMYGASSKPALYLSSLTNSEEVGLFRVYDWYSQMTSPVFSFDVSINSYSFCALLSYKYCVLQLFV